MNKTKLRRVRQTANYSVYSHQSGNRVLSCLMQLLLLYLAVLSTVLCVSTSLAMTVSVIEIVGICLIATLLFAAALLNKITTAVFTGSAAMLIVIFWGPLQKFFATLVEAVRFCYDLAFVIMKMKGWDYTHHMLTGEEEIAILLENEALVLSYFRHIVIVLAIFYAFWFIALSWKKPRIWPTVIVSLGVLAPGFTIGLAPSAIAFSMLLAASFGLYVQTLPSRYMERKTFKSWLKSIFVKENNQQRFSYTLKSGIYGICTASISLVLMLIVALVTYSTPLIQLDQVREYLDEGTRYVYNQVFYKRLETPDNAIGNLLDGEAIDVLKIPNIHNVPVYYLTSKENQAIYLRAWVTDLFTEEGWLVLNESDDSDYHKTVVEGTDPNSFAYQMVKIFQPERFDLDSSLQSSYGFVMDTLTLKARFSKSLVAHLPSYTDPSAIDVLNDKNAEFVAGEMAIFNKKRPAGNTYIIDAFEPIITSKGYVGALHGLSANYNTLLSVDTSDIKSQGFQNFKKQERSYYEYAKRHYLSTAGVPEIFSALARNLSSKYETQLAKVLAIEKYFRNNSEFSYTLKPEQLLDATTMQQLEHSVITKREGYCTYYATAMTFMVRSLGYPARFVNGYYVRTTDKEPNNNGEYKRTVMDGACHAWVEVYFDGIGWMTFDPTPDTDETQFEYNSRYYALELEDGTSGDGKGNGAEAIQNIAQKADFETQPEDDEVMPTLSVDYGIYGGKGLRTLIIIAVSMLLAVIAVILIVLRISAEHHAKIKYESVFALNTDGNKPDFNEIGRRMHTMMLRWLELAKLERHLDETAVAYAQRIDQTLQTENSFEQIAAILQKCEFSEHIIIEDQYWKIQQYYDELYRKIHKEKGKINWIKKFKV